MALELGARIKQLRKEKKFTLKEIAEKSGLSISFISQLEHNKTSATLETFKKISEALDVSPGYFFDEQADKSETDVVKANANDLNLEVSSFIYKDLKGAMEDPLFLPILVVLNPGDNRGNNFTHDGQEFLYVLEGELTVLINDESYILKEHESIFLDSSKPHYWENNTGQAIKFLYISAK